MERKRILKRLYLSENFPDRYLYGNYKDGVQAGGRISYVKLFSAIALFILAIACIYLSIHGQYFPTNKRSRNKKSSRSRQGNSDPSVSRQIHIDEFFISTSRSIIDLSFTSGIQFDRQAALVFEFSGRIILTVVSIALATGIIAGSYPALYISGFKPALILKGNVKTSIGELWMRKGLVIFQFTLSVILIAAVLIVYKQVNYIQTKNLGYNRDNIIDFTIPLENDSSSFVYPRQVL